MKLFMLLLGGSPPGRRTEQHDVLFAIANTLPELIPAIRTFWPEAKDKIHVDAWREIQQVDGWKVTVTERQTSERSQVVPRLFFVNLGGYKMNEFEEFHYKMVVAGKGKEDAVKEAKKTAFYLHTGFKGATSHIDDKYGIDVDDFFEIEDALESSSKNNYQINLSLNPNGPEDPIHLGYLTLSKLASFTEIA